MTRRIFFSTCVLSLSLGLFGCSSFSKENAGLDCFEMRTYYAAPGKLNDLHARFRNHTLRLFEKHGIQNVGYWVPLDNVDNKLIFLLGYPSRAARDEAWRTFMADPDWKAAKERSEANGPLVTRAEQIFLQPTDYSPGLKLGHVSGSGIFELRTYNTPAGLLPNLDARFRDHTMDLFARHGMNNWIYFHKTPDQPNAGTTLIYFLTHASREAAKASFDGFRKDPAWTAAREASEKKADGPLTVKDGGVRSEYLVATDYSPTR